MEQKVPHSPLQTPFKAYQRSAAVKRKEGEDGGGQGWGPGSPVAAKGSPKHGADGCTDSLPRYQGHAPGTLSQDPRRTGCCRQQQYNMRLEDYEPYPDDGMGYGDHPKLPDCSQQERDPWYDWDHPDLRLNWGEPMHWDLDMYRRNRVGTSPTPVNWNLMCKYLFGFVAFMLFMFWVGETYPAYQPVGPKQYPYNNLYLERGGGPNKEPEPVVHYEI